MIFQTGATALHLSIAYGNDELAQEIVSVSNENAIAALLKTVASGKSLYTIARNIQYMKSNKIQ